ncbi:MAG: UDP-glucose/GDP-mannose dehydrogenase family protein [Thermoplasmata archaeon]|nr:UDP-glucose/GDP-mannose dehydrogenase family protein [Thermoplasmata archaeon]
MGLTTALAFAHQGVHVVGYDIRSDLLGQLRQGRSPVFERGLAGLLRRERRSGRFGTVDSWEALAAKTQVIFLCLPTPRGSGGRIDLGPMLRGASELGRALRTARGYRLVVVKSTVVPGTSEDVLRPALEKASHRDSGTLDVAANPEFLAEGSMVRDAVAPERVVIGVNSARAEQWLRRIYRNFGAPIVVLSPSGAELVKYSANAFLALKVGFANEMSRLAEMLGVNVDHAMDAVGLDSRIGGRFLSAGPGFGGSCFEKDVRALLARGRELGVDLRLIRAVLAANDDQTAHATDLIRQAVSDLNGKTVAVLGLSFKAGTDDVRESRAFPIVRELAAEGAKVRLHDPVALENFRKAWTSDPQRQGLPVSFCRTVEEALQRADAAVLQAAWPKYVRWPPRWSRLMRTPLVVDLRRALDPSVRRRAGLRWVGLGVGTPARARRGYVRGSVRTSSAARNSSSGASGRVRT